MKRLLSILLVLLVAVSFAWANGEQEKAQEKTAEEQKGDQVVLEFYYYKSEIADGMNAMAKAFQEKNPNVVISNEMIGTEYNTVIKSRNSSGNMPEVWAASSPGERALKPYTNADKIYPVDDFAVLDDLKKEMVRSITFSDGHIYTIPLLNTARGIIYNQKLFEQAGISEFPETFNEMKTAVQKLNDAGITPFAVGGKDGWTLGSLVYQCGAEVYAEDNFAERMWNGEASHDEMMEIFNFIDLFKNNSQDKPMNTDFMGSVSLYAQEKAAMLIQGPWAVRPIKELAPEVVKNSRMEGIPYTNDPERNKLYFDFDAYFCVSSQEHKDIADEYFDFIVNSEKGRKIFKEQIKAINPYGIEFDTNPVVQSIQTQLANEETLSDTLYVNAPDGWWQNQATVMQEYIGGQISKSEMMQKLDDQWLKAAEQQN